MSYRFCLGASGAGKSTYLHQEVIRKAGKALDGLDYDVNYIFLVPEQYTMQTQKELVLASGERGGILNVDVLSFGRLAHRVFEEIGAEPRGILDDMGKSLILRRLSLRLRGSLKTIGPRIGRPGMTAEVKSVISEFMQYGITPGDAAALSDYARAHGQGRLAAKLSDIGLLYQAFLDERANRFLTGEEQYDLLAEAIPRSGLMQRSVVVLDGFTGFTPVQARVILALMQCARDVVVALDWGEDGGTPLCDVAAGRPWEEQDLFGLTRQCVAQISRIAREGGVEHGEDICVGEKYDLPPRFADNPAMAHLERSLFRSPVRAYPGPEIPPAARHGAATASTGDFKSETPPAAHHGAEAASAARPAGELPIHLVQASNPGQEVRQMCIRIRRLIEQNGWAYRDFAVIAGDLATYEDEIRVFAGRYDLPVYIDAARPASLNPLTETIRAALQVGAGDYSYETVFHFLRSGLAGLRAEEIDRLENYCLKRGVKTRRRWETAFDAEFEPMRLHFLAAIEPLRDQGRATAAERTRALYAFLVGIRAGEQMQALSEELKARGQDAEAMEYGQLYGALIHLLEELHDLPGEDPISAKDYLELVEAGFAEIRLGTLPQQADRILVGDLERTRLSEVKALFVLGVNDGLIPKAASSGGLLSDLDRAFLEESGVLRSAGRSLSPTPRQQMANQRFYLYMNLTQPTRELVLSYAATSGEGESIRPSYLIGQLQQLFPGLSVEEPEKAPVSEQLTAPKDAAGFLAASLRSYADGAYLQDPARTDELLTIYGYCVGYEAASPAPSRQTAGSAGALRGGHCIRDLRDAAFLQYRPVPIRKETARALYGRIIRGSATRLEGAAKCYLQQFLKYGLRLREREEYTFEARDSGTILHDSLLRFGQLLEEEGLSWTEYSAEEGEKLAARALRETAGAYRDQVLYATARGDYQVRRMQRILERTVQTLQFQLQQGDFVPAALEQEFGERGELSYDLGNGERLILTGRIDRVDLAREEDGIYVKILDYKSGSNELKEEEMRAGLQLQLMVYMNAERALLARRHPGTQIVPAAMLYYRFDDPLLKNTDAQKVLAEPGDSAKQREIEELRKALRPTGKVIAGENTLVHLDHALESGSVTSRAVRVRTKDNGTPYANSPVLSAEAFEALSKDMEEVICGLARDILAGRTDASPVRFSEGRSACSLCPYADACGFDLRTPGYRYREIDKS